MAEAQIKESPFSPGRPVQPEYFVARIKEIQRLERSVNQTILGKNENVFITGPRGIGKSSLAGLIKYIAEKHSLIGSHCFLGGVRSLNEMIRMVFQRLLQDCKDESVFDKLKNIFGDYIKSITLFGTGVEFTKDKGELQTLVDNFLPLMRKIYDQIQPNGKKGLTLILDDLNGISDVPQFSQFLKSFVDELATSGKPLPVFLILVGLPERREDLIKHQPSVARIFDVVELPVMAPSESEDFFKEMFDSQNIEVDSDALSLMVNMSGGYPMLMHEVGDAVFWQDKDNRIDINDAGRGISEAAQIVGKKYIDPKISKVLRNKTYASILSKVDTVLWGETFERQEIMKQLPEKEQDSLDNFLRRARGLGIIELSGSRGEYKFANPLYHLYMGFSLAKLSWSKE
ncbi:MAG: hypothetical protein DRP65_03585 [Planctomycetota bacterium]|nr:MAG: hypothetical protein DRP65_03585 [Planctomycetota bacterium]